MATDTDMPVLHQIHERVLALLHQHADGGDAACLDQQQGRIDYYGDLAPALPAVVQLAEMADLVRFDVGDGDVRLTSDGMQLTVRSGLRLRGDLEPHHGQ